MALAGQNFFLEKMGKQTEDCENDQESGIGRIDGYLNFVFIIILKYINNHVATVSAELLKSSLISHGNKPLKTSVFSNLLCQSV